MTMSILPRFWAIMLTNMNIDNKSAYRTLKQLGAIVCFQNKEVTQFMAHQGQILKQLANKQHCFPKTGKPLVEIK